MKIIEATEIDGKLVPVSQYEVVERLLDTVTELAVFNDPKDFTRQQWNSLKKLQKAFKSYNDVRFEVMDNPFI
jgi:hypothetical protein